MNSNNHEAAEQELLNGLNRRDPKAFGELYEFYYRPLCYFVGSLIKDPYEAKDIASDTFYNVWKSKNQFPTIANFYVFLNTTARNICYNYLIKKGVIRKNEVSIRNLTEIISDPFFENVTKADLIQAVHNEIASLPERQKAAIESIFIKGLSTAETAKLLQITIQTVRNLKADGLDNLRKIFSKKEFMVVISFLATW